MQITSIPPVSFANRLTNQQQQAADKQKADLQANQRNAPLQPTPALRPTVQDKVEMTRALLALRGV